VNRNKRYQHNEQDVALMLRVRQDDESAFEELYHRYVRRLLDFFYAMGRDAQQAEDLVHETFLRVWRQRTKYAATGSFQAYLFAFARFIWLERYRKLRRIRRWGLVSLREDVEEAQLAVASGDSYPDVGAGRAELGAAIFAALDQLPNEQRMAFVLHEIEGLSNEDIATVMQCPVNTVRSRRILAVKKLRESLERLRYVQYR
jgi:RNA polymerase sigma-70 factor, ECF subfamily